MKHITGKDGTAYISTSINDGGNDLGLEVNSLYSFDIPTSKYVKSGAHLIDIINSMVEVHDIPLSREVRDEPPSWSRHYEEPDMRYE